jgi:hypothetical protein
MPYAPGAGASPERLKNIPSPRFDIVATPAHAPSARDKSAVMTSDIAFVLAVCIVEQLAITGMARIGSNLCMTFS